MTPLFAALPDIGYLIIVCVVVAIAALIGLGVIMRFLREIRSGLAEELRREIAKQAEATPVTVQTPLEVREATIFATKPELAALDGRLGGEIHQLHGRVSGVRAEVGLKIDDIDKRIDAIPLRVITLLRETQQLHTSK